MPTTRTAAWEGKRGEPPARIRLVTRGDDAGSSETANRGILEACIEGNLLNVSVMLTCPHAEDAAARLKGLVHVCFGLHGTLNAEWDRVRWGPVLSAADVPSLVRKDGTFFQSVSEMAANGPDLGQALAELQAQLDRGRKLGFSFSYVDEHMYFGRGIPGFAEALDRFCEREGLLNFHHYHRSVPNLPAAQGDPVEKVIARLEAAGPGQWAIIGHPGYDTEEMRQIGNAQMPGEAEAKSRDWQRRWFTDPRILAYCREKGIQAIRYDEAELLRG